MSSIALPTPFGPVKIPGLYLGVGAVIILGGAAYAAYKLYGFAKDPNKGTAYEGNGSILTVPGAVATLGNVTNQVLGGVPQTIGEALGSGLFTLFNPDAEGSATTYIFTFPDGTRGAVNSNDVDSSGYFTYSGSNASYKGTRLQLVTGNDGKHVAVTT